MLRCNYHNLKLSLFEEIFLARSFYHGYQTANITNMNDRTLKKFDVILKQNIYLIVDFAICVF